MDDSLETHCLYCSEKFDAGERTAKILHDTGGARNHISCTSCLRKILRERKQLVCPECNTPIDSSIEDLQTCQIDDEITQVKQVLDSDTTMRRCSNCGDQAHFRCEECRFYFCNDCKPGHVKNKSFSHHNVRELSSLTTEEINNFQEITMCDKAGHGLPIDMYCQKCEVPCCLRCEIHSNHGYVKLAEEVQKMAEVAKRDGKAVLKRKDEISSQIQTLEEGIVAVGKKNISEEDNIKSTVRGIIQSLELQEKVLLDELHKGNSGLINMLEVEVRKRKDVLCAMNSIEDFLKKERQIGDIQQLELYKNIQKCSTDLKDTTPSIDIDVRQEASYFVPNKELQIDRYKLGFIHCSSQEDDKSSLKGCAGPESVETDVRILAIGKKKSGRTTTSFALMEHETRPSSRLFIKQHKNKTFKLRRSPGVGPRWALEKEKADIFEHLAPGPHILLFTIKNPDDDVSLIQDYTDIFKDDVMKHVIVVFTGKKELDKKKMTVDKYVQSKRDGESQFGRLLNAVTGRYIAVNTDNKDSLEGFREAVFRMACDVMEANSQRYLSVR